MIELSIEAKLYIEAKGLPADEILEISFLPVEDFHKAIYENEEYLIVAYDNNNDDYIGINKHGNVYFLGGFDSSKMYISRSLVLFVKLLLSYQSLRPLLVNCSAGKLKIHVSEFRKKIEQTDKTALKNSETYWSRILEHMCVYPPDMLLW